MEIIKAFQNNELNIPISIIGSSQEPLLRASDIGTVLGISNIRTTIAEFDNTEKVVHTMDTLGGKQEVNKEFYEYLHRQDWDVVLDADNFEDYITNVDSYNYSLRFPYDDIDYFTNELINIMKIYH